jgi:hypothetical protein
MKAIIFLVLLFLAGCSTNVELNVTSNETPIDSTAKTQIVTPEALVVPAISTENTTLNITSANTLKISGNLNIQSNLDLCPHVQSFFCDKYDVRYCDFNRIVGKNGYYPDMLSCRSGREKLGENPTSKYCFIQECGPIAKNNIVTGYGGYVIFAEYSVVGSEYTLKKCGEENKMFDTRLKCNSYKSKLENK